MRWEGSHRPSKVSPKLTDVDSEKISKFYAAIRDEAFKHHGAIPMTVRHIESMIDGLERAQTDFLRELVGRASERCVVVCETEPPNHIVACSKHWSDLCGFPAAEAIGLTPKILQGACTDQDVARDFRDRIYAENAGAPVHAEILNYTKQGRTFHHCLETTRVTDASDGVHYFCTESFERRTPQPADRRLAVPEECAGT